MSPRIKKSRKVFSPPVVKGFKPYGVDSSVPGSDIPVILNFEEYESLRLCDYDMYNHYQASVLMGISRPTYTRIYALAREKIATAFVEGRRIVIEGGRVHFDTDWFTCSGCGCYFNNPEKGVVIEHCPLCMSREIHKYEPEADRLQGVTGADTDNCICPSCGYQKKHIPGKPCSQEVCPDCNARMRRAGSTRFRNRNRRMR